MGEGGDVSIDGGRGVFACCVWFLICLFLCVFGWLVLRFGFGLVWFGLV